MKLRPPSRIAVKLLLFNVLLVFLPVAGVFSLRTLERQLLDLQERSMVQQGRLVAAALAGSELDAESARSLMLRLDGRLESRIRVVDRTETLLADSASTPVRPGFRVEERDPPQSSSSRTRVLYRIGAALWRPMESAIEAFRKSSEAPRATAISAVTPRTVVRKALAGRYGASLQESAGQRSLTLYSALPIREGGTGHVVGAVIVSQSTSRILRALWQVRLHVFRVFVISVIVAGVLSLLVSATIARPLVRLRDEADDLLDHRGRLKRTFRGSRRSDEIGDLTRALEKFTARLERHLAFVESLPADVSHEFKNPLASIRSAAELLASSEEPEEKQRLGATIDREVARLSRLLNGVREVSKIDAALETEPLEPVDLRSVVSETAQGVRARVAERVSIDVSMPAEAVVVTASADRLAQAFRNIVDNAVSFSPDGAGVTITLAQTDGQAWLRVDDEGPGIPPEHVDRVFERFFSFRPDGDESRRDHDGLGLSIARAVIEGYGGTIQAMNRTPRGARFDVRLPLA